jgi:hypothetical protein
MRGLTMDRSLLISSLWAHAALVFDSVEIELSDDVVRVDALPLGATGKLQNAVLRERHGA